MDGARGLVDDCLVRLWSRSSILSRSDFNSRCLACLAAARHRKDIGSQAWTKNIRSERLYDCGNSQSTKCHENDDLCSGFVLLEKVQIAVKTVKVVVSLG